ncbi:MAG: hypothetical protein HYX34_03220 [Actinobacteria bacterium]|nr:hypothetical protein [Actinomycetota bacterium]
MPAAVLVVVILGAIALDFTVVYEAQRELVAAAQGAANDAAGASVDQDTFFRTGTIVLDEAELRRVVAASLARRGIRTTGPPEVRRVGERQLEVRVQQRVELIFARGVPGAAGAMTVTATATADLTPG